MTKTFRVFQLGRDRTKLKVCMREEQAEAKPCCLVFVQAGFCPLEQGDITFREPREFIKMAATLFRPCHEAWGDTSLHTAQC